SLFNQDQGIRVLLQVINDLFFVNADQIGLHDWGGSLHDELSIEDAISSLKEKGDIYQYLKQIVESLILFDWRSSDATGLSEQERTLKASFRGSGGYKEIRKHVLKYMSESSKSSTVKDACDRVIERLKY